MRHKPKLDYCGLTIVLSNPSRFDSYELLSATAGHFFFTECLGPEFSRHQCDIRTRETIKDGILNGTCAILLLGDSAFKTWADSSYISYTIGEQRGSPLKNQWHIPMICSYFPQDCIDVQDYETRLNPQHDEQEEDREASEIEETKRKGTTKRSNWRFWLKQDTKKICSLLYNKEHYIYGICKIKERDFRIAPNSEEAIHQLSSIRNEYLYVDIETDTFGSFNLKCIGYNFQSRDEYYVLPFNCYNNTLYYHNSHDILRALAIAFKDNIIVCHHSHFDLFILAWRYGVPFGRNNYDTMLAFQRCFPEVEKSLGHGMSLFTWEPYHKDEGIFNSHSSEQDAALWHYNAKDVAGMKLLHKEISKYASSIPGLEDSIAHANRTIYPYLLNSLWGMYFDNDRRIAISHENDRVMTQYLRILNEVLKPSDYKDNILPTSNKSCVDFFHHYLCYEVISRSRRISKKTGHQLNTPSLDEKSMWKLKLKYPQNPMIDVCIRYRQKKKETSMLQFTPWEFKQLPICQI